MKAAVVGAGAWGTAFAVHLARMGHETTLVPRRAELAAAIAGRRENADYLPGVALPPELGVEADLGTAASGAEAVFLACPSQALRETAARLGPALAVRAGARKVVNLAKGLEGGTHLRPSQVLEEALGGAPGRRGSPLAVPGLAIGSLTGPTNAAEIARGLPAAMVLAFGGAGCGADLQAAISNAALRVYTSDDLPGVELGGALKNVYAIAAGCAEGLGLGDNAKAGLLTRSLAEMIRVGTALGARTETFYGLSGFGDLVATAYGDWSRNRDFGRRVGAGTAVADLLARRRTVVEGYRTTDSFAGLCEERRLDAPILREMRAILFAGRRPADALESLMTRGLKDETA
jgi:glycerol-3-phosphate dehydrogenase (NAD(P)+)